VPDLESHFFFILFLQLKIWWHMLHWTKIFLIIKRLNILQLTQVEVFFQHVSIVPGHQHEISLHILEIYPLTKSWMRRMLSSAQSLMQQMDLKNSWKFFKDLELPSWIHIQTSPSGTSATLRRIQLSDLTKSLDGVITGSSGFSNLNCT